MLEDLPGCDDVEPSVGKSIFVASIAANLKFGRWPYRRTASWTATGEMSIRRIPGRP